MTREENTNSTIEALILASSEPVSVKRLSEALDDISPARVRQGIDDLNNIYLGCGCSFRIREVAGGYQIYILPDFEQPVKRLLSRQRTVRLSRPALETLAIIAYKQPATKTEIEHIRGVAADGVLHNLLERKLIIIAGRSDGPGRPLLYKTSNEFLKFFGLNRISDLPRMDEIEEMIRQSDAPREQTVLPLSDESGAVSPGLEPAIEKLPEEIDFAEPEADPGDDDGLMNDASESSDAGHEAGSEPEADFPSYPVPPHLEGDWDEDEPDDADLPSPEQSERHDGRPDPVAVVSGETTDSGDDPR